MIIVGLLKATQVLRHDLARLVGVLELIGGVLIFPRFEIHLITGCLFIAFALGLVISVPKSERALYAGFISL